MLFSAISYISVNVFSFLLQHLISFLVLLLCSFHFFCILYQFHSFFLVSTALFLNYSKLFSFWIFLHLYRSFRIFSLFNQCFTFSLFVFKCFNPFVVHRFVLFENGCFVGLCMHERTNVHSFINTFIHTSVGVHAIHWYSSLQFINGKRSETRSTRVREPTGCPYCLQG